MLLLLHKTDSIGMPVLFLSHRHKTACNPATGIPFLPKFLIQCLLSNKFIQPVISIIIADKKYFLYVLGNGWQTIHRQTISIYFYLPVVAAVCKHRCIPVEPGYMQFM